MAFKFYDTTTEFYYLKVDGNELKLVTEQPNHSSDDFWFEKVNLNGSPNFGLKCAAKNQFIMIHTNTKQYILGIDQEEAKCCRFTQQ